MLLGTNTKPIASTPASMDASTDCSVFRPQNLIFVHTCNFQLSDGWGAVGESELISARP